MSKKQTAPSLINEKLPYSQVVIVGDHYYFSGVIPNIDKNDPRFVEPVHISKQTKQVFVKIKNLLKACNLSANDIYSATVMLSGSMQSFSTVNEIYSEFFTKHKVKIMPRRKAFAVAALPFNALIEIEFDAIKQK